MTSSTIPNSPTASRRSKHRGSNRSVTKFDPEGNYARRWLHELADVPFASIHRPWREAPGSLVQKRDHEASDANRLVEHDDARRRALEAYKGLT
ncbi:FAD-binding domain-containing protein [Novosphingobium sp. UBA1939]|uniref:FAD-binding domain-containing protein n=1 Tax=Novosphingobium sp. UBA1939 TaxID=1946982 RepID=UPI0039C90C9D